MIVHVAVFRIRCETALFTRLYERTITEHASLAESYLRECMRYGDVIGFIVPHARRHVGGILNVKCMLK